MDTASRSARKVLSRGQRGRDVVDEGAGWSHGTLDGRVVLVTGGARRVGRAIVERLAAAGATVAVHANRSIEAAEALVAELEAGGAAASAFAADLLDAEARGGLVGRVVERLGRLDALVNSASLYEELPFEQVDAAALERMLGIHVAAPFDLIQQALPHLRAAEGSVVNMLDAMLDRPRAGYTHYAASKAGLMSLTRSLAVELAPDVRVNGVAPGAVLMQPWEDARGVLERVPQGRSATAEEIAATAHFLIAGPGHITGHILTVDGAYSLHW